MSQSRPSRLACLSALLVLGPTGLAAAQGGTVTQTTGPDIIVGDLPDVTANAPISIGGISYDAFAVGTTSCNRGNALVNWFTGGTDNRHPAISQNLYRYSPTAGRFEQIGQGSLKHGFTALQGGTCNSYFTFGCTPNPAGGTGLGIGCSDPYGSGLNDSPGNMGPRWQVNAATGLFPYPYTASANSGPSRIRVTELNTSPANARYFIEGQYIVGDDADAGNKNNNASFREVTVNGSAGTAPNYTAHTVAVAGAGSLGLVRELPGIYAWQMLDPSVTITTFDVPNDGRFILASKVTGPVAGAYTYEYALHNLNSQRCAGSLVIPLPGTQAALTNIGFHDVEVVGEPNSLANPANPSADDWTVSGGGAAATQISWAGPTYSGSPPVYTMDATVPTPVAYKVATFTAGTGIDHTANVIRWGTMFNFRFTSTVAPGSAGSVAVGLWRPGTGTAFVMTGVPTPASATVGTLTATCCNGIACTSATQAACTGGGGIWGLPGTTCTPNPCINGACCLPALTCSQLNNTNCSAQSGTYQGDGTACGTSTCPTPGACCLPTGPCTQSTSISCATSSGVYHGNSTACASTSCPTGACCASAGTCSITASSGCTTSGSTYRGDGSTCSTTCPVGACCLGSTQTCTSVSSAGCTAQSGGYQGDNTTCTGNPCPFGACCQGCAGCIITSPTGCSGSGAVYSGNGSVCATAGCSLINGGFESGAFAPGWTQFGNTGATGVFANAFGVLNAHGGTYGADFGPVGSTGGIQQTIPAHAGDMVTIGFWYAIEGGGSADSFTAMFDGQTLVSYTNDTGHTTWTQYSFPVTVSADNPILSFTLRNDPSYDLLDDITVCIISTGACCNDLTGICSVTHAADCVSGNTFHSAAAACTPNPCPPPQGMCCRGATCNVTINDQASCTGSLSAALAGGRLATAVATCNATGNSTSPCCYADYDKIGGIQVADIFAFLQDWFGGYKYTIVGGDGVHGQLAVQNIFDFLGVWFAGGC